MRRKTVRRMGSTSVYLGEDTRLGRKVAIKVLPESRRKV